MILGFIMYRVLKRQSIRKGWCIMEETVTCNSCSRMVPKTLYCIYCGAPLFNTEREERKPEPAPKGMLRTDYTEPMPAIMGASEPDVKEILASLELEKSAPKPRVPINPEIADLMEELKNNYVWKIKLCGMLNDGAVSGVVFSNLYQEYAKKINQLNQVRQDKLAYYDEDFGEKRKLLDAARIKLEEVKVRAAIGQIPRSEVSAQTPGINDEIERLAFENDSLEAQIARLNNLMGDMPPLEIFELEKTAKRSLEALEKVVAEGQISDELGDSIEADLKETIRVFDGVIGDKKDDESQLRDELSTLEARYKVGEINISEYESKKRRIITELQRIWE